MKMKISSHYLSLGRRARDHLFGTTTLSDPTNTANGGSHQTYAHPQNGQATDINCSGSRRSKRIPPLSMLISQGRNISNNGVLVMILGVITLIAGVLLTTLPWLDYCILKNLRLWNNTISFHYWQKPGVVRLSKVYIFNVTNPDGFLAGEKPKLVEVGPFVYREEMEKTNIQFHDNYTVSFQHKKILKFVPELSVDKDLKIVIPNIPLLTLTSQSNYLGYFVAKTISFLVSAAKYRPFVEVTAEELVFGYDDTLVALAHKFYPRHKRPMSKMGLLVARNGTLSDVYTINTGQNGMENFGYYDNINGARTLPSWPQAPCNSIKASEGSLFPPRALTGEDTIFIYDKDVCRTLPFTYTRPVIQNGISADRYELTEDVYDNSQENQTCFNVENEKPIYGLQNISPCQYGAPVYVSNPHFYKTSPELLEAVEGLKPEKEKHESYIHIQPKLGVPLKATVRAQMNFKVEHSSNVEVVKNFRDFMFPVMWLEEGVAELTPSILKWIYMAVELGPVFVPLISYGFIVSGAFMFIYVFVRAAYKNMEVITDPTELLELGRRTLRSASLASPHLNLSHLQIRRNSYTLLSTKDHNNNVTGINEYEDVEDNEMTTTTNERRHFLETV